MNNNLYTEFRKLSPRVTGGLIKMRAETFKDAVVPAKYKILAALAIVVATKRAKPLERKFVATLRNRVDLKTLKPIRYRFLRICA